MTKLSEIVFESGDVWVHEDKKRRIYTVFVNGITHSTSDSAYATLDLAQARAEYLAGRITERKRCSSQRPVHQ